MVCVKAKIVVVAVVFVLMGALQVINNVKTIIGGFAPPIIRDVFIAGIPSKISFIDLLTKWSPLSAIAVILSLISGLLILLLAYKYAKLSKDVVSFAMYGFGLNIIAILCAVAGIAAFGFGFGLSPDVIVVIILTAAFWWTVNNDVKNLKDEAGNLFFN